MLGLIFYLLLKVIGLYGLRKSSLLKSTPGTVQAFLESWPIRCVTILLQVGAVILVLDLLQTDYGNLLNCTDWTLHPFVGHFKEEWILFTINVIFFNRLFFTFMANNFNPKFIETLLDTQLVT